MLVAHFRAIDQEGQLPFVIYGGPGDGSSCRQMPATFTKVATDYEHLVAWKIAVRGVAAGENSFAACVEALKKAQDVTGREVAALIAGDANLYGALEAGGDGTINACESVRVDDNTALYNAFDDGRSRDGASRFTSAASHFRTSSMASASAAASLIFIIALKSRAGC